MLHEEMVSYLLDSARLSVSPDARRVLTAVGTPIIEIEMRMIVDDRGRPLRATSPVGCRASKLLLKEIIRRWPPEERAPLAAINEIVWAAVWDEMVFRREVGPSTYGPRNPMTEEDTSP